MLERLQRQPQRRASEEPRARRVEELRAPVAVRGRRASEAEARRGERHVEAGARERGGELVVVLRCERRGIGDDDAHVVKLPACSYAAGTSSTATRSRRGRGRTWRR